MVLTAIAAEKKRWQGVLEQSRDTLRQLEQSNGSSEDRKGTRPSAARQQAADHARTLWDRPKFQPGERSPRRPVALRSPR